MSVWLKVTFIENVKNIVICKKQKPNNDYLCGYILFFHAKEDLVIETWESIRSSNPIYSTNLMFTIGLDRRGLKD